MRPQPEGRGERRSRRRRPRSRARFNAATARRPWRTIYPKRIARRSFGLELQCGHSPKAVENLQTAQFPVQPDSTLQCGHDPKAVENLEFSQPGNPKQQALQCGHSPKAVENGIRFTGKALEQCFNAATTRRPWRTPTRSRRVGPPQEASMRPQPEGRGEPRRTPAPSGTAQPGLQCGHDPKAVENIAFHPIPALRRALASMRPRPEGRGEPPDGGSDPPPPPASMRPQPEGRGEHLRCCSPAAAGRSFNAATARRPWRTNADDLVSTGPTLASMRPRPEGRGEPPHQLHELVSSDTASMRPQPEGRGEPTQGESNPTRLCRASMRPQPEGRGER